MSLSTRVPANKFGHTAFVPNGENRRDMAILLLGFAEEKGLDPQTDVVAANGGFYISDALADALGEEGDEVQPAAPEDNPEVDKAIEQLAEENPTPADPEEAVDAAIQPEVQTEGEDAPKPAKKASGNRAAKNATNKEK